MAKGYRRVDRDQPLLLAPDMREWIRDDPVWLVIEIIEQHLDTSAFHAGRRVGGVGRAGYDPDVLLTLLVWAWMQGVFSSRRIERLCGRDLSFRVICAGDVPDHVTIARFRQGFAEAVQQLFAEVLVLCHRLGLGQVGMVALDGTKIAAPASPDVNRTEEGLRKAAQAEQRQAERAQARDQARNAAARHAAQDVEEDACFGDRMGDAMSEEPPANRGGAGESRSGRGSSRARRIAAALADLEAEREQAGAAGMERAARRQARVDAKGGRPVDGRPPAGSEIVLAAQALAKVRAEVAERYQRWQLSGRGRNPCPGGVEASYRVRHALARVERAQQVVARREARQDTTKPGRAPVRNITDPQSRLQPQLGGGWVQGYNAQAVATSDGIVLATSVSNSPSDSTAFVGLMRAACVAAEQMGAGPVGTVLADAGYLTVDNLTAAGPDRLIAVGKWRDLEQAARNDAPSHNGGQSRSEIEIMRARLKTPDGIAAYRQRGRIIETVFGHGKHNWNFTRFTGCGLRRAETEWAFHGAVHNLAKIVSQLAAQPNWRTSG
jgi:transposase